ncbi:alpha/beta hydrolase [Phaeobacter sp. J2-8]|uniref:alpha/beta hydrolase n=1 Tax=Phaeobacter sp. J2-8 TaxID=2931394 RepID=UPI001FD1B6C2|nr:alpha/beta hydrolase [Phaeobacter sp. J2-8]MCJ7871134.1 alpha/beta hydrolase [Phaeobacter sp. J2-8]
MPNDTVNSPYTLPVEVQLPQYGIKTRLRRHALDVMTKLSPRGTARMLARRHLTPSACFLADLDRYSPEDITQITVDGVTRLNFPALAKDNSPSGKRILIVPGLDGHFRQFLRLIRRLQTAGVTVDLLVLPGHLGPQRDMCSMRDIAESIHSVTRSHGPYDGVIAHCVGCNGTLFALKHCDLSPKLAFVSTPVNLANLVRQGGRQYGLDGRCLDTFVAEVSRLGAPYAIETPWDHMTANRSEDLLVVHARQDWAVPFDDVTDIGDTWPGAKVQIYEHGEHNSILNVRSAITEITSFMTSDIPTAANT